MNRRLLFAAAVIPIMVVSTAPADSLWDRRDPRQAYLFDDSRARRVGDLLTIEINEATANNETEQRAMTKGNSAQANFGFSTGSGGGGGSSISANNNSSRQFNGSAQLTTGRTFTDRLTVSVIDVLPNGNLVVEGYRSRVVAGELRELRITGIVRPIDVTLQNVVQSRFVGNFRISYIGRGPESNFVNQGWFSRIINKLWPF
jgi:flagellar L-ring protein precursor FlgH